MFFLWNFINSYIVYILKSVGFLGLDKGLKMTHRSSQSARFYFINLKILQRGRMQIMHMNTPLDLSIYMYLHQAICNWPAFGSQFFLHMLNMLKLMKSFSEPKTKVHKGGAYPSFCDAKWMEVINDSLDGTPVHCRLTYSKCLCEYPVLAGWTETMWIKCLV